MSLSRPLTDGQRLDWLRLARTRNVGPVTFAQLILRYGDAGRALEALPEIASRAARGKSATIPPPDSIAREIDAAAKYGARIVASCEPDFPALLHALDPPPPALTLPGNAGLAAQPTCAIVGARNA